ncbi:hypothetical protein OPV22_021146 [Ensete ventricosum]|uniref:Uncharacterized protein n=1 Tax=Ensete ventricosum TaxID=4639 RepID=A0AAV8QLB8_ENSVE|nr:hypothetical protein OPV22_021146 [Ensete ventricosum]
MEDRNEGEGRDGRRWRRKKRVEEEMKPNCGSTILLNSLMVAFLCLFGIADEEITLSFPLMSKTWSMLITLLTLVALTCLQILLYRGKPATSNISASSSG